MKISTFTFGCRVNQSETEWLRESLLENGHSASPSFREADMCLVNTCTVTHRAERDAVRLLRKIQAENPGARIIVTGCWATRDSDAVRTCAPNALVVENKNKKDLPVRLAGSSGLAGQPLVPEATRRVLGKRGQAAFLSPYVLRRFHGHCRAFVKIQDGCEMRCSYCVVPIVRQEMWSKPVSHVVQEVRGLISAGYREVVLCGIRLGRYLSHDPDGRRVDFVSLLERLIGLEGDFRIRLSSLEITNLTPRLVALFGSSPGKLCPSFHLPLQSGSDAVLKRMRRWYTADFYRSRIDYLRRSLPEAGIFSDVMVGFPGETESDFLKTRRIIEDLQFSGLHIFRYSPRPQTEAAKQSPPAGRRAGSQGAYGMKPVCERVAAERSRELHRLDRELRRRFAEMSVGRVHRVLVEKTGALAEGFTEHFLKVRLRMPVDPGEFIWVGPCQSRTNLLL